MLIESSLFIAYIKKDDLLKPRAEEIFDAIYAATALTDKAHDHTILSTDPAYDRIPGIKRVDPREIEIAQRPP